MTNLSKYRRLSIVVVTVIITTWLFSLATLWNSLLTADAKHEGWVVFFMILTLLGSIGLFMIALLHTNSDKLELIKQEAYKKGKDDMMLETEKSKHTEQNSQHIVSQEIEKTCHAVFSGLQGIRSETGLCNKVLVNLARELEIVQGIIYIRDKKNLLFHPEAEYALTDRKPDPFKSGESLPGQVADSKTTTVLYDIPENYFTIKSGLGSAQPRFLILVPVLFNNETIAVIELAAFKKPNDTTGEILSKVASELGIRLNKFVVD